MLQRFPSNVMILLLDDIAYNYQCINREKVPINAGIGIHPHVTFPYLQFVMCYIVGPYRHTRLNSSECLKLLADR